MFDQADPDKLFSYYTTMQVRIQDRYVGLANYCLQFLILSYIVFGIFIFSRGYLEFESAKGAIASHIRGDVLSISRGRAGSRYFSAEEITYPGLENGNVFVTTRQNVRRQRRAVCEDSMRPCVVDSDCTTVMDGKCSENGFCLEPSWCDIDDTPEIYTLDVGDIYIWIKSSIQFLQLARDRIYSTESNHPYPEDGFNAFTVREILMMCEPVPVRFEEISELGAAIEVLYIWDCNVQRQHCRPTIKARRIDVIFDPMNIGYAFNHAEYVSDDERILNEVRGVRIFLRSVGTGRRVSLTAFIMKVSTTSTLVSLAPIIADLLMLRFFSRKDLYFARKFAESPDFSEKIPELKRKKEKQEEEMKLLEQHDEEMQRQELNWQKKLDEEDQ